MAARNSFGENNFVYDELSQFILSPYQFKSKTIVDMNQGAEALEVIKDIYVDMKSFIKNSHLIASYERIGLFIPKNSDDENTLAYHCDSPEEFIQVLKNCSNQSPIITRTDLSFLTEDTFGYADIFETMDHDKNVVLK